MYVVAGVRPARPCDFCELVLVGMHACMRKVQVQGMWHYCSDADLCYVDTAKAHSPP